MDDVYWIVTNFDGDDYVRDKQGEIRTFTDHSKAERVSRKEMGAIVLRTGTPPEPDSAADDTGEEVRLTELEDQHIQIIATANKRARTRTDDPELLDAYTALLAIEEILARRANLKTICLAVVAQVSTERLHLKLGYPDVRSFLKEAGMNTKHGDFYHLSHVGDNIVPYLEHTGQDIARFIGPKTAPKLLAASSALRTAITEEDVDLTDEILQDIILLPSRDAVRAKYHKPRNERGHGYETRVEGGHLVTLVLNQGEIAWMKAVLGNKIVWDLTGAVAENNSGFRVDVAM
jgi:hypothetical protein